MVDKIIIKVAATQNIPKLNIGYLKARKSSIGLSIFWTSPKTLDTP
jgi:hypothetical protein